MNRIALIVLGLTLISELGCSRHAATNGSSNSTLRDETEPARLVGIVAISSNGQKPAYADLEDSKYRGRSIVVDGKGGRDFETQQVVKIKIGREVQGKYHDYFVLLGSEFDSGEEASGELHETGPAFVVEQGWAMGSGDHVEIAADWVSGAAEGFAGSTTTHVVIEIVGRRSARFYLLEENDEGAKLTLTCKTGSRVMDTRGTFVRVDKCTFGAVKDINTNGQARDFIEKVTEIAEETGWAGN